MHPANVQALSFEIYVFLQHFNVIDIEVSKQSSSSLPSAAAIICKFALNNILNAHQSVCLLSPEYEYMKVLRSWIIEF